MSAPFRVASANVFLLLGLLAASHPAMAGSVEYIHTDALGTPVAITDADRNVLQRSEYEPYGKLLNRPAEDGPGFTGHVTDQATGLSYMQQRYYDPGIGRFLSVDPVTASGNGGNFNRYLYAAGNPYRFTDPDGRRWKNPEFCNPCGSSGPVGAGGTGLGNQAAEFNFSRWAAAAPRKGTATVGEFQASSTASSAKKHESEQPRVFGLAGDPPPAGSAADLLSNIGNAVWNASSVTDEFTGALGPGATLTATKSLTGPDSVSLRKAYGVGAFAGVFYNLRALSWGNGGGNGPNLQSANVELKGGEIFSLGVSVTQGPHGGNVTFSLGGGFGGEGVFHPPVNVSLEEDLP